MDEHVKKAKSICWASGITFIEDREEISINVCAYSRGKTHLIIRCCRDRKLKNREVYTKLSAQPVAGSYEIKLVKDIHQSIAGRQARVE